MIAANATAARQIKQDQVVVKLLYSFIFLLLRTRYTSCGLLHRILYASISYFLPFFCNIIITMFSCTLPCKKKPIHGLVIDRELVARHTHAYCIKSNWRLTLKKKPVMYSFAWQSEFSARTRLGFYYLLSRRCCARSSPRLCCCFSLFLRRFMCCCVSTSAVSLHSSIVEPFMNQMVTIKLIMWLSLYIYYI